MPKSKFPKFLVWQCLDENGNVSEPFIRTGTINSKIYLKECLEKRMLPFIKIHHNLDQVLFWPDMASSHYEKKVVEWLKDKKKWILWSRMKMLPTSRRLDRLRLFGHYANLNTRGETWRQKVCHRSNEYGKISPIKWPEKVHRS